MKRNKLGNFAYEKVKLELHVSYRQFQQNANLEVTSTLEHQSINYHLMVLNCTQDDALA